ncbi:MAG: aminotransferase class III-fold pyridoxal phosphate-dependent enzyme [Candidatus Margulisbacteria bacterium]|nr:aminotransferase class III-fold pyridoxal phosphate-dependent enzyme [Candidatus Margulisiibacteriota bacterium]
MSKSSVFGIKIDFEKSNSSYVYDKITQESYLDFFGQYSTLAIGYNHPIFSTLEFQEDIRRVSSIKVANCEMLSDEAERFDHQFRQYTSKGIFTHYHYTCTGALAIESALKTAIDYTQIQQPRFINFKGSFHGINSYGGIVTDRFFPVSQRLEGLPGKFWEPFPNPIIEYKNNQSIIREEKVQQVLNDITTLIKNDRHIAAILVEPIQCTFGDRYFPNSFFIGIRRIADEYNIPLIFDEIQIGFGGSGKTWYFEHLPIEPDIVAFGKKTQLSGIMVKKKFARIFETPIRLEVTWDADIIDMIRCMYIMKAYQQNCVLENVVAMGKRLYNGLKSIPNIQNIRQCGLLVGFDFETTEQRNQFMKIVRENQMICNPTRDKSIRLRPHLLVNASEIDHALNIMQKAAQTIVKKQLAHDTL